MGSWQQRIPRSNTARRAFSASLALTTGLRSPLRWERSFGAGFCLGLWAKYVQLVWPQLPAQDKTS